MKNPYGLNVLELAAAEMLDIHAQLDKLEIPKFDGGERLSAAQRVTILVSAFQSVFARAPWSCEG